MRVLVSRIGFEPMTPSLKGKRSPTYNPLQSHIIAESKNPVQGLYKEFDN